MTPSDPRVGEIQARQEPLTGPGRTEGGGWSSNSKERQRRHV